MPAFLLAIFGSSILKWIIGGALAVAIASGVWLIRDYRSQAEEIVRLTNVKAEQASQIKVLQASRAVDANAIKVLDQRLAERNVDLGEFCTILGEVQASKAKDADEKIDETVGTALERLKKKGKK